MQLNFSQTCVILSVLHSRKYTESLFGPLRVVNLGTVLTRDAREFSGLLKVHHSLTATIETNYGLGGRSYFGPPCIFELETFVTVQKQNM